MRTRSAVGRVADPRGVVSRCPFSSPASTLTRSPEPAWFAERSTRATGGGAAGAGPDKPG